MTVLALFVNSTDYNLWMWRIVDVRLISKRKAKKWCTCQCAIHLQRLLFTCCECIGDSLTGQSLFQCISSTAFVALLLTFNSTCYCSLVSYIFIVRQLIFSDLFNWEFWNNCEFWVRRPIFPPRPRRHGIVFVRSIYVNIIYLIFTEMWHPKYQKTPYKKI